MGAAGGWTLGLCGTAIMVHNFVRFESPFEWGQNYQLSGAYEGKLTHFSVRFFPHNFWVYMFQALNWTSEFPFVLSKGIDIFHIPGYFGTEEVSGLAVTFPFFWFVLALPLSWRGREASETRAIKAMGAGIAGYTLPVRVRVLCYVATA